MSDKDDSLATVSIDFMSFPTSFCAFEFRSPDEESFCGTSVIVPDLEGALYLKEDGKKSWKRRYFLLRASGIYYVPKGKTKTSQDLACFIQFDNVHVYYGTQYKNKYKAPTDYCFVLKLWTNFCIT
ncbi:UNVERIFIED_CONTAM: hypothetical protein FKN15_042664 [Acipenser sinensis]